MFGGNAIRNDDIDRVIRQRDVFNGAFQEFDVIDAGLFLVFVSKGEHFVGHIQAVSFAGGANTFCGEDDVNAAAGAEVEDNFARLKLGERGGITAAQRRGHGLVRHGGFIHFVVEIFGDGVAAAELRPAAAASGAAAGSALRGLAVFLLYCFLDVRVTHRIAPLMDGPRSMGAAVLRPHK